MHQDDLSTEPATPSAESYSLRESGKSDPLSSRIAALETTIAAQAAELTVQGRMLASQTEAISVLSRGLTELKKFLSHLPGETAVVSDPRLDWCEAHLDELARIPNEYAAIDLNLGVIASAVDQREFATKLEQLDPELRRRSFQIHTSQFV